MTVAMEPVRAKGSLRERWIQWRNGVLGASRFQRWAAGFPLTRPIARRRSRALFDLCAGFVYAQVLTACVRLRLFEKLQEEPGSAEALAPRLRLPLDSARRLLQAASALDLAERLPDGRYALGPLGAVVLGNPGIAAMVEHHDRFYADLADPVALLRGERGDTALAAFWPYAGKGDPGALEADEVAAYSSLMARSQPMIAAEVVAAYPFYKHTRLLDAGGGEGAFLAAVARSAPDLELWLFDLPAVAERARLRLDAEGLQARSRVFPGDLFADGLPVGADIVSLVRILHDHDDAAVGAILRAAYRALPQGGTLLIAEPMSGSRHPEPVTDAYFGLYLLAMGQGRARSREEHRDHLKAAGFTNIREWPVRQGFMTRVLTAERVAS